MPRERWPVVWNVARLFQPAGPQSAKMQCRVCGRTGYAGGRWQDSCRGGHAPCRSGCGRLLATLSDGSPRRHSKCPADGERAGR